MDVDLLISFAEIARDNEFYRSNREILRRTKISISKRCREAVWRLHECVLGGYAFFFSLHFVSQLIRLIRVNATGKFSKLLKTLCRTDGHVNSYTV